MDEIVKMIYEHWRYEDDNNIDWGNYLEAVENIHNYLNGELANDIESKINSQVWTVEKNAFVAGFKYACECISNGQKNTVRMSRNEEYVKTERERITELINNIDNLKILGEIYKCIVIMMKGVSD